MKISVVTALAFSVAAEAHCIFQNVAINGADQGSLVGLRAPNNNLPVQDATSSSLTCGAPGSKSDQVLEVQAGDEIGAWYQHVIGGAQFPNDPDNPIASSHKGPVTAYLAKVDDAAGADAGSAAWSKIWEDTFDPATGVWGVDNLLKNDGWVRFDLPACIPDGQYLLRVEVMALHSAYTQGGVQFYSSCAQLNVSGGGEKAAAETVKIPGAYSNSDPSVLINIYGTSGGPDMDGKPFPAHGPAVFTC
ncbi:hypothetical protein SLS62_011092 [Diatrype stigma]|uniref:lytic cellulose monooxygenase (C4-dehydrogenating) n=1 Tax=Diatrype stigma TaxID=117547 RepID=A0AAN9U621_9PEZI